MEVRSTSPRTVLASEKAMAESAAASHSTASSAEPRPFGLLVVIVRSRVTIDMHGGRDGYWFQTRWIRIERRHLNADRKRPSQQNPVGPPSLQLRAKHRLEVRKAAVGEAVRQHERSRANGNRQEALRDCAQFGIGPGAETKHACRARSAIDRLIHHQTHAAPLLPG